jgi:hypothetical protein
MNKSIRIMLVSLLLIMPFVTFGIAIFLNLVKLNFLVIAATLFLGFPFWGLFILPIVLLFKLRSSLQILYLIIIIASLLVALYIINQWTTSSYGITIGNVIYVEKGVPTAAYYTDILVYSALVFLTIMLSSIFFIKLVKNNALNSLIEH